MGVMTAIAIGATVAAAGAAVYGAYQSRKAQEEAAEQQAATAQQASGIAQGAGQSASGIIGSATDEARSALNSLYGMGGQNLQAFGSMALNELGQGYDAARASLQGGLDLAGLQAQLGQQGFESTMAGGLAQTLGQIGAAQQGLESAGGRIGETLAPTIGLQGMAEGAAAPIDTYDVRGGLADVAAAELSPDQILANIEADPGYQFRQQQGEQAINRAAAARGGRLSGRTMQELMQFNQGLASQEAENVIQRRMALAGQRASLGAQGVMGQAASNNAAALQAQSNQMGLAGLGFGAAGQMAGLQAGLAGQVAGLGSQGAGLTAGMNQALAQGQMAGGNFLANLAAQGGTQMANLYTGQGGAQAGILSALGGQQASMNQAQAQALASLIMQGASGQANAIVGGAGGQVSALMGGLPYTGTPAGGEMAALAQGLSGLGGNLMAYDYYRNR